MGRDVRTSPAGPPDAPEDGGVFLRSPPLPPCVYVARVIRAWSVYTARRRLAIAVLRRTVGNVERGARVAERGHALRAFEAWKAFSGEESRRRAHVSAAGARLRGVMVRRGACVCFGG